MGSRAVDGCGGELLLDEAAEEHHGNWLGHYEGAGFGD